MSNVNTSATLWPTLRLQVADIIRELIREHTSAAVALAREGGQGIRWELRVELWLSFTVANPAIEIDLEEFMVAFRNVHGLWPAGQRMIRRFQ